ncbi:MAG: hypothetical protein QXE31_05710 [Candidatus Woesearchaeota archaeon]
MKKAQSLSINTIIIAILAMLVLVILIFILGRNVKNLNDTTEGCRLKGGDCKEVMACDPLSEIEIKAKDCNENEKCCMPMFNKENK